MTDLTSIAMGDGEAEYRVVRRAGCVLIYGSVPLEDMGTLVSLGPKDSVVDFGLPVLFGATFVFGLPADLKRLKEEAKPELLQKTLKQLGPVAESLTQAEIEWLAYGDRGVSSETIFQLVRGIHLRSPDSLGVPSDPSDLRRCRLLIDLSPYIAQRFKAVLMEKSDWKPLIESWDELCAIMDAEAPAWREGRRQPCQRTMEKMAQIFQVAS